MVPFGKDLAEIIYRYCIDMGILNDSDAYLFPADDSKAIFHPVMSEIILGSSEKR